MKRIDTRMVSRWLLAALFVAAGVNHFINPGPYVRIVPPYLPAAEALVFWSGVFEVLGGVGLLIRPVSRFAAWGLIALLVAVFPANLNMALHPADFATIPAWVLWARLPLQAVLIAWVWWTGLSRASGVAASGSPGADLG